MVDTSASVDGTSGGVVTLPEGFSLGDAQFQVSGFNLIVIASDGAEFVIRGFFFGGQPPSFLSADGTQLSGEFIKKIAGP
ncbi:MAG: hypothetical protein QF902_06685 [Rhodospirillales bacterium]|jgi:hypothetical protein|nr:hypothetical protein [Rhodospirillales bacterium]